MPPHSTPAERGLILGLKEAGLTVAQILAHPGVHIGEAAVRRWIQRFEREGYDGLKTRPRSGRPKVVSEEDTMLINATVLARPFDSVKDIVQELTPHLGPHMDTVYERIKAAGTKCRMAARCPGLTEDDKFQRLSWAHDHAQYNEEFWNQVVWTDETSHRSDQVNRKRVWRADGTRYEEQNVIPVRPSGRVSLMQWFAMSGDLGAIARVNCPPNMTALDYLNVLNQELMPRMDQAIGQGAAFTFMHDNAPIHTAGVVEAWFYEKDQINKLLWPPYSPDCNPIENLFGLIALEWDTRNERTPEALEQHAEEVFQSVVRRPNIFRLLSSSVPRRIQAVIESNGGPIKY